MVALLPPMVISTSMMFMGKVTLPVSMHHRRNCSLVVEQPTRTYFLPPSSFGPFTNFSSTTKIEFRSFACG